MIRLPDADLPPSTQRILAKYQQEIDALETYPERVAAAKAKFAARNTGRNTAFRSIRTTLASLCSGARRCMYCGDSCADEVEHFKPKDFYPEAVFVWSNYLYACGRCNGPKGNHFAVFLQANGAYTEIIRLGGQPIVAPEQGEPVLIHPRFENPLDYIELDLSGTFLFLEKGEPDSRAFQRAQYTLAILQLNDRDELIDAREQAYRDYRARLHEYIHRRNQNRPQAELEDLVAAIGKMNHPAVWQEMKRQHTMMPELHSLFEEAPEALHW